MSKRSAEDKIKYYNAKIAKLCKKKTKKPRHRVIVYSSSSNSDENSDNENQRLDINNAGEKLVPMPPTIESPDEVPAVPLEVSVELTPELDPELLEALGDAAVDIPVFGPEIHTKLAQLWLPILKKGLASEAKQKLVKDYSIPDNCRLLKAPTLNPEISAAVHDIVRSRDKKIQAKQDQLGLGISAINKAMTLLLTGDDKVQAVKILSDGCRFLTDLHFTESQVRTKLITPGLDKAFLTLIQDQDRDEFLFGDKLPDKIRASKAIEKQGLQIKKAQTSKASTSSTPSVSRSPCQGNWSGPPRYPPPPRRGGKSFSYSPYRMPAPQAYRRPQSTPSAAPPTRTLTTPTLHRRAPARQ